MSNKRKNQPQYDEALIPEVFVLFDHSNVYSLVNTVKLLNIFFKIKSITLIVSHLNFINVKFDFSHF